MRHAYEEGKFRSRTSEQFDFPPRAISAEKPPVRPRTARALTCVVACACFAAVVATNPAFAQQFPAKPVRIIVPYPPGGGGDLIGRLFSDRMSKSWGQTVLVENRPGAASIIGTDAVAKAAPDGYTLLVTTDSPITSVAHLYAKLPFDPLRDLAPITLLVASNLVVAVHPSVPARTLGELAALAKAQPGRLNYGSWGSGSAAHLLFEAFKKEAGIDITHVPYSGLGPVLTATVAGDVQMTVASAATALGQIQSGKLKALAISRADRSPLMPELPTLRDSGFPNIDPQSWFGIFAPGGTSPAIVSKIQRDLARIIADPDFREKEINRRGYTPGGWTPEAFAAFIKQDFEYKRRLIQISGAKAE